MNDKIPVPVVTNVSSEVLQQHLDGELITEFSRVIQQAIQAVKEHGKRATINLELSITSTDVEGRAVFVDGEVTSRLPKPPPRKSLFYTTDDNRLVKRDPNQREMELKEVIRPPAEAPIDLSAKLAAANAGSAAATA